MLYEDLNRMDALHMRIQAVIELEGYVDATLEGTAWMEGRFNAAELRGIAAALEAVSSPTETKPE